MMTKTLKKRTLQLGTYRLIHNDLSQGITVFSENQLEWFSFTKISFSARCRDAYPGTCDMVKYGVEDFLWWFNFTRLSLQVLKNEKFDIDVLTF